MSKIYECLKNKANNKDTCDKIFYSCYNSFDMDRRYQYTYKDVFNMVNESINLFQKQNINNSYNSKVFLIVNTSISDLITMISLMELGINPILVSQDVLYLYYQECKNEINSHLPYDIISPVEINKNNKISLQSSFILNNGMFYDDKKNYESSKEEIKNLIMQNVNLNELESNFDFALLTSGTTGYNKICPMKEEDLIKSIYQKYDLQKEETFVCQNPISSISGLLFTLYIPIISNNKKVYNGLLLFTDPNTLDNHLNIIVPGNYFKDTINVNKHSQLISDNISSKIEQITLLGTKTNSFVLKYLHNILPNMPYGKIVNYYGRTENNGLISAINDNDMTPLYLYYQDILPNRVIYSTNKKDVYVLKKSNGIIEIEKTIIPFNENLFCELYPIAKVNTKSENIKIKEGIFNEIIADNIHTGDYGIKLENKIYYLGRSSEIIKTNNTFYYLSGLEENLLRHLASNPYNLNQNAYCVYDGNEINVYVPCEVLYYRNDNYREHRAYLNHFISEVSKFDVGIDNIYFTDKNNIPRGCEIGKLRRGKLQKLKAIGNTFEIDNIKDILRLIKDIIQSKLNREIEISYDNLTDYIVFNKNNYSTKDIAIILKQFKVLDFKEDDNNYYLAISDEFIFATYEENKKDDDTTTEEYINLIINKKIRDFLLKKNNLIQRDIIKIGLFYNDNNQLTGVINTSNSNLIMDKHSKNSHYWFYQNIIQKEVDFELEISKFETTSMKYYFNREFSIDDDNNLYCDGKIVNFDYSTTDISKIMKEFLIKNKDCLKKEEKSYAKR